MPDELAQKMRYLPESLPCPVCANSQIRPVLDVGDLPVQGTRPYPGRQEALSAPRGKLLLALCGRCGHLFNAAFRRGLMPEVAPCDYAFSPSRPLAAWAADLARSLTRQYALEGKTVLEIACGRGEFLSLFREMGAGKCIGFDPTRRPRSRRCLSPDDALIIHPEPFSTRHGSLRPDFVCCRHHLDHLERPADLLELLRTALRPEIPLYAEVPDAHSMVEGREIWNLGYEHVSYFCERSLDELFRRTGFVVRSLSRGFAGQFLQVEALSGEDRGEGGTRPVGKPFAVEEFARRFGAAVRFGRATVNAALREERRPILWGAGSEATTFLNVLGLREEIPYAVTLDRHKEGKYLSGTGQRIVVPEFLKEYRPAVVIVTGEAQQEEARLRLREMEVPAELVAAW